MQMECLLRCSFFFFFTEEAVWQNSHYTDVLRCLRLLQSIGTEKPTRIVFLSSPQDSSPQCSQMGKSQEAVQKNWQKKRLLETDNGCECGDRLE